MQVGNIGTKIVFETSDSRILTYSNLNKTVKGRWAKHEVIMQKPRAEFLGADLQEVTFSMTVNALYGVSPRQVITELERIVETGEVNVFVLGGRLVGGGLWSVQQISETYNSQTRNGELLSATLEVTMQEYY